MKVVLFFTFSLSIFFSATAQKLYNDPEWKSGVLILTDNSYFRGNVKYNQTRETVSFKKNDNENAVSAEAVRYMQFYDKTLKNNRAFVSLSTSEGFKLFETVLEGEVPLYRKAILEESMVVSRKQNTSSYTKGEFVEYIYFVAVQNKLIRVEDFKEDVLPFLRKHISEVAQHIFINKLDLNHQPHQILLVDYYNGLVESEGALSQN